MESEKKRANASCKENYIGRYKAACELGVNSAVEQAKKQDALSHGQKYKHALARCQRLEKPLVAACLHGVNRFKSELAKKVQPEKKAKVVAKAKRSRSKSRAPASAR